ncbi:uncharacterized protein EAE97_009239 [Botrytis byssoidea]|uniref:Uncharacterized protein n=1 Tax=Botrytis byssoidea TaxID=139641 RepID=A0A9P5LZX6_9HELO|nr:uncharacterized protein EAE97_009239 [Botrytis byssoidea]KAF7931030.1 hypothetical protein EAE97_009239 [Botrytis byssoidea]
MSYSSEAYDCCFNGNLLETCQYCGGSPREPPCPTCRGTGISHRPCPYHSSSASYYSNNLQTKSGMAELSDNWAPDVLRVRNRGRILSLLGFGVDFFLMTLVSNELAIHPLARPQRGEWSTLS